MDEAATGTKGVAEQRCRRRAPGWWYWRGGTATGSKRQNFAGCGEARGERDLPAEEYPLTPPSSMSDTAQGMTMDRILQEISAVGCKLEGMDSAMASLMAETKSMCLDIAGFRSQFTGLDQRVTSVETHIGSWVDRD
ncbi:hypothetical protein NDU88_006720 [Pleurodeles waltl]|uniref:Uncharacterized protein n=1 Tax=Pleurodeles waltl TaxID=8319 RepID=A0AAV7WEU1_PLEWA|nr:hypothetical protein NDU88_006720 [Pleurodeles waltl]